MNPTEKSVNITKKNQLSLFQQMTSVDSTVFFLRVGLSTIKQFSQFFILVIICSRSATFIWCVLHIIMFLSSIGILYLIIEKEISIFSMLLIG